MNKKDIELLDRTFDVLAKEALINPFNARLQTANAGFLNFLARMDRIKWQSGHLSLVGLNPSTAEIRQTDFAFKRPSEW